MKTSIYYICKECQKEFTSKDTRGAKFCSRACSCAYNNHNRIVSKQTKTKISTALKKRWSNKKYRNKESERIKKQGQESQKGKHKKSYKSMLEFSKRTISKILKRLNIVCSQCGWNDTPCDMHHIIPRAEGGSDDHSNLTYICPNCHRKAGHGLITKFTTLSDQIGDKWQEYYYG